MMGFFARRMAGAVASILAVCIAVFLLLEVVPGDPAALIAGDTATPEAQEAIRTGLGLDRPLGERLVRWFEALSRGDLGTSLYTRTPVVQLIEQRFEPTATLALVTLTLALLVALPTGIFAAWRVGGRFDQFWMLSTGFAYSLPVFFVGYLLSYVFAVRLGWLPVQGFVDPSRDPLGAVRFIILPSVASALPITVLLSRVTRASFLDVLSEDFIRTARAKGAGPMPLLLRHAARNAGIPIITTIGASLGILIEGVVLAEVVFNLPGLGRLTADAVLARDYPVIQGLLLVFATFYVLLNLLIDLSYAAIDPRVSLR